MSDSSAGDTSLPPSLLFSDPIRAGAPDLGLPPIPEEAASIGLVGSTDGPGSARWAARIAEALGRERAHVILICLETGTRFLDEHLGLAGSAGLPAVLSGRRRMVDVALPSGDRGFIYVPAGPPNVPAERLLESSALHELARRIRARKGSLVVYFTRDALAERAEASGLTEVTRRLDGRNGATGMSSRSGTAAMDSLVSAPRIPLARRRRRRLWRTGWRSWAGVLLLLLVSGLLTWAGIRFLVGSAAVDQLLQTLGVGSEAPR